MLNIGCKALFHPLDDSSVGQSQQPSVSGDAEDLKSNASNSKNSHFKLIKTWKGYIWDTWDLPKDQRWLLSKLDAFVLTFASVSSQSCTQTSY